MHKPFSIRPPPQSTLSRPYRCFSPSPPFPPPPFGVCNLPERPPRFPPPLSTLAPFSYPLILSQPFSLRKCRSAIHLSSSSIFLSFLPFSFYFLCFPYYLFLSTFLFFYPSFKDIPPSCSLFSSLSLHQKNLPLQISFLLLYSSIEHCPSCALFRRATA